MKFGLSLLLSYLITLTPLFGQFKTESVLKDGSLYKIKVEEEGIYKISSSELQNMGISTSNISNIHLLGNKNGMLSQLNGAERDDDWVEIPVWQNGNDIYFYALSAHKKEWDKDNLTFNFEQNLYDDNNYYIIKVDNTAGLRIQDHAVESGGGAVVQTFDAYAYREDDLYNMLQGGREWLGDIFNSVNDTRSYSLDLFQLSNASDIKLEVALVAQAYTASHFDVTIEGQAYDQIVVPSIIQSTYGTQAKEVNATFEINPATISDDMLDINLVYSLPSSSKAYVNKLKATYTASLQYIDSSFSFRSYESAQQAFSEFRLQSSVSGLHIWDITDPLNPAKQQNTYSGGNYSFERETQDELLEFVTFNPAASNLGQVEFVGTVANQNLHSYGVSRLLIICPDSFLIEANRIKDFKESYEGMSTQIATLSQIYNEYSSGRLDVSAIRDFTRNIYLKSTPSDSLKYLMLLGDGSYDYKRKLAVEYQNNILPTYQARNYLNPIQCFTSDDFYGIMGETEGFWSEDDDVLDVETVDVGVGRIPARTKAELNVAIDKIIHYVSSDQTLGKWRNRIVFVADDGDQNGHQLQADAFAEHVNANYPDLKVEKLYLDAYPQLATATKKISPIVQELLYQKVTNGSLIVSFSGHGDQIGWTEEEILLSSAINDWGNYDNLPFFVTATCEFGRYDAPQENSGAELMLFQENGGGIGLVTTTRPVYSNFNEDLANALYSVAFERINGEMPRLGDLIRLTKNADNNQIANRNFSLIGDPSLRLAYPKLEMALTSLNGQAITSSDTISALEHVFFEGEVQQSGVLVSDFTGIADILILDKAQEVATLGDEADSPPMTYLDRNAVIYSGQVSVVNGQFSGSFIVPQDIIYAYGNAKVFMYAQPESGVIDAYGSHTNIKLGGTAEAFEQDDTPPIAQLYMNDTTFINGGLVASSADFIAVLYDENGINTTGIGVDHDIVAILDGDWEQPIVLNEYFSYDLDSYQKGRLSYPLTNLEVGEHYIEFRAWDSYNNVIEERIDFVVADTTTLEVSQINVYPNPADDFAVFAFSHNWAGENLMAELRIYDQLGREVEQFSGMLDNVDAHTSEIRWNRSNRTPNRHAQSVYYYKVMIYPEGQYDKITYFSGKIVLYN